MSYLGDYLRALFRRSAWDHIPDVGRGVARGFASGGNTLGQMGIAVSNGLSGLALPGYKRQLGELHERASNWLSDLNREAQGYYGDYDYQKSPKDSFLRTFSTAPGQAVQQTVGTIAPLMVESYGFDKLLGAGRLTRGLANSLSKGANRLQEASRIGAPGGVAVKTLAKAAQPVLRAPANYLGALTGRTGTGHFLKGAAVTGGVFPMVDRLTGLTHMEQDDSSFTKGLKKTAGKAIPWMTALDPVQFASRTIERHPAIYENKIKGLMRGLGEQYQYQASPEGLAMDFVKGPVGQVSRQLAKKTVENYGDYWSSLKNHARRHQWGKAYDVAQRMAAGVPFNEAKRDIPTDPLLTAVNLQDVESRPVVKNLSKNLFGPVNPLKAAAKGLFEASLGNKDVPVNIVGKANMDKVRNAAENLVAKMTDSVNRYHRAVPEAPPEARPPTGVKPDYRIVDLRTGGLRPLKPSGMDPSRIVSLGNVPLKINAAGKLVPGRQ